MIKIIKSPSADSRTAKGPLTPETLSESTLMHINDIRSAMLFIKKELQHRANIHDHTKMENMDDFCAALNSGHVKDTAWYQKHVTEERHHLKSHVPEDVNLLDVLEHVVDCTMAGLARSGEVFDIDLSPDVLVLACENTMKLLKDNTEVIDPENPEETKEPDIMDDEIKEDGK